MASFLVLFRSGACDLLTAERALVARRFRVANHSTQLAVTWPGSQEFRALINAKEWVLSEAVEIGERTSEPALSSCDSRLEVSFDDLDAALDEFDTMMEIQVTLQEVSGGFLFLPWNGNLLAPQQT